MGDVGSGANDRSPPGTTKCRRAASTIRRARSPSKTPNATAITALLRSASEAVAALADWPGPASRQSAAHPHRSNQNSPWNDASARRANSPHGSPVRSHAGNPSRANCRSSRIHNAWISTGYPSRGVPAGWFVSIHVKCDGLHTSPLSASARIPFGVPTI